MSRRKGIILAGGSGTRLHPLTLALSKHLMPIYDKPMIYYPISVLMLAGITDILVITTPDDQPAFQRLLRDGSQWGIALSYAVQPSPDGLAQAFIIGREFLAGAPSALALGDNVLFGSGLTSLLANADRDEAGAVVFGYRVSDPQRYGVVEFGPDGTARSLVEKPSTPRSDWAVIGLYYYDHHAPDLAAEIKPSARGELEITDLNRAYLDSGTLRVERLGRGYAWFDTGTYEALYDAADFIRTIERRQGLKIGCVEEVAFRKGYIDAGQLERLAAPLAKSGYGDYLRRLLAEGSPR